VLIDLASHDALTYAATLLGIDDERPQPALRTLADSSPADLAKVAGAIACGIAETWAYHSTGPTAASWFRLLVEHGWEPDAWTAGRLSTISQALTEP
jgi:hypothetical protein